MACRIPFLQRQTLRGVFSFFGSCNHRVKWTNVLLYVGCWVGFIFLLPPFGMAQPNPFKKGNHYAVVAGIAAYKHPSIDPLQYSERDATVFADFLLGGSQPRVVSPNLRLLLGKTATVGALIESVDWLLTTCQPGDTAWFYFSGHGDVETRNSKSQGYLLGWNSPPNNYANNALSVAKLNEVAFTLSARKKVYLVLITDACHSGKLAGDMHNGREWVAQQLGIARPGEVRIASCRADEEAQESNSWGGGRGVFSYYFLEGLMGKADYNRDGVVWLEEAELFVDSSLQHDGVLKARRIKQHPQIKGIPVFPLSFGKRKSEDIHLSQSVQPTLFTPTLMDTFFQFMDTLIPEEWVAKNFFKVAVAQDLPLNLVDSLVSYNFLGSLYFNDWESVHSVQKNGYFLKELLSRSVAARNQFLSRLAVMIHNRAQEAINAYLEGDLAELNKRQYYYSGKQGYGALLSLIDVGLRLPLPGDELRRFLTLQSVYLKGLQARMKLVTATNPGPLLREAFIWQRKALAMDPFQAAYIYNELGILHLRNRNLDSAAICLERASMIAPTWAIPWSNTISLQLAKSNFPLAQQAAAKASALQPNLPYALVNQGIIFERQRRYLSAEGLYKKAIAINNVHFYPFERLGHIYLLTGRLTKANYFFKEAEIRKLDQNIAANYFSAGMEAGGMSGITMARPDIYSLPDNILGKLPDSYQWLCAGLTSYYKESYDDAIYKLQHALTLQHDLPLAHHYIGAVLFKQNKYPECIPLFKQAIQSFKEKKRLIEWFTGGINPINTSEVDTMRDFLDTYVYMPTEDYFFAGTACEHINQKQEAIAFYKQAYQLELQEESMIATYKKEVPLILEVLMENAPIDHQTLYNLFEQPKPCISCLKICHFFQKEKMYEQEESFLLQYYQDVQLLSKKRLWLNQMKEDSSEVSKFMVYAVFKYPLKVLVQAEAGLYEFYNRMQSQFPAESVWFKKGGLFLFNRLNYLFSHFDPEHFGIIAERLRVVDFPLNGENWTEGYKRPKGIDSVVAISVPGTDEILHMVYPGILPLETATALLKRSIQLGQAANMEPSVLNSLARLAHWQGKKEEGLQYYQLYLKEKPRDTTALKGWLRLAVDSFEYEIPYDYLLGNPGSVLGTELQGYATTAALFNGNLRITDSLRRRVNPSLDACIRWLRWFRLMDNKQYPQVLSAALRAYRSLTKQIPEETSVEVIDSDSQTDIWEILNQYKLNLPFDEVLLKALDACSEDSESSCLYLIARLYALQGKPTECIGYLNKLADNSLFFQYYWLLKNDPAFAKPNLEKRVKSVLAKMKEQLSEEDLDSEGTNFHIIIHNLLMVPYTLMQE